MHTNLDFRVMPPSPFDGRLLLLARVEISFAPRNKPSAHLVLAFGFGGLSQKAPNLKINESVQIEAIILR
jgi:hypothetical protein